MSQYDDDSEMLGDTCDNCGYLNNNCQCQEVIMTEGQKWKLCVQIAENLNEFQNKKNVTKFDVKDYLFDEIEAHGWLELAQCGEQTTIETIISSFDGWKKLLEGQNTPTQRIKVALWFIEKCGGIENAKQALKSAIKVLK